MSYFKSLKLTKKGEQLQAKINGNLSETLVFTKAKVGSGRITSDDEIRFLTDIKEAWETANIAKCELQGTDNTVVALELQFSNQNLTENKIFREIGLYARGNDDQEILYAYANAGDNYDYIPLMRDSPHSFIITIYFTITSGTKIDANIDLNSYISLKKFNEEMAKKVNKTDYASNSQYGIVKYGAEQGTALEGNMFPQMIGKEYGGLLNVAGQKIAGKAYFDNNTKKLYICKNNNSDISANVNNYIPFDNNSILDRLENLFTINNLRYDSGNLEKLINGNWQNIATISDNDKILSLTVFGNDRIRVYSYTFIINTLKYPDGIYFITMSTANLGYVGGFIRVNNNVVQVKSTYNSSSHDYYVRNIRIYS